VLVFDIATAKQVAAYTFPVAGGQPATVAAVAFSSTGMLAAGTSDGRIERFLAPSAWRALPLLHAPGRQPALSSLTFSPGGRRLAVVSSDGSAGWAELLAPGSGKPVVSIPMSPDVTTATFTPDGKTLLVGDGGGFVHFWNAETGKRVEEPILVNLGEVNSLDVDATGSTLVVGGTDGATWLFDLATRTQIGTPLGADASTSTAAIFAGTDDATPLSLAYPNQGPPTLTRWNLHAGFLAARACAVARRNLTRLEWEQILPNRPYAKVCQAYPLSN
jgi:WD40 repeat protein